MTQVFWRTFNFAQFGDVFPTKVSLPLSSHYATGWYLCHGTRFSVESIDSFWNGHVPLPPLLEAWYVFLFLLTPFSLGNRWLLCVVLDYVLCWWSQQIESESVMSLLDICLSQIFGTICEINCLGTGSFCHFAHVLHGICERGSVWEDVNYACYASGVEMFQWPSLPFGKLHRFRKVIKFAPHKSKLKHTLSPIIMDVKNYPKWKETNIGWTYFPRIFFERSDFDIYIYVNIYIYDLQWRFPVDSCQVPYGFTANPRRLKKRGIQSWNPGSI